MINMVIRTKVMIRNREMMTATNMVIKTRIMVRIEMVIKAKVMIKNLSMIVMIIMTKMMMMMMVMMRSIIVIIISAQAQMQSSQLCWSSFFLTFPSTHWRMLMTVSGDVIDFCDYDDDDNTDNVADFISKCLLPHLLFWQHDIFSHKNLKMCNVSLGWLIGWKGIYYICICF